MTKPIEELVQSAYLNEVEADSARIDKLEAVAVRKGCGWNVDHDGPYRKHWSQEPEFATLREALDSMA